MRLLILLFALGLWAGCVSSRTQQAQPPFPAGPDFPEGEEPASESGEYPVPVTDDSYTFPWEVTEGASPSTETTMPAAPAQTSPPAIGAEDLALLPEAAIPARGASLNLTQQGRLSYMNRDYVAARGRLQSALQIWGGNAWAKYYLGLVDFAEGNYTPAAVFAKAALRQMKPYPFWSARANFLLGEALERLGRHGEAVAYKEAAYQLDPRVELR